MKGFNSLMRKEGKFGIGNVVNLVGGSSGNVKFDKRWFGRMNYRMFGSQIDAKKLNFINCKHNRSFSSSKMQSGLNLNIEFLNQQVKKILPEDEVTEEDYTEFVVGFILFSLIVNGGIYLYNDELREKLVISSRNCKEGNWYTLLTSAIVSPTFSQSLFSAMMVWFARGVYTNPTSFLAVYVVSTAAVRLAEYLRLSYSSSDNELEKYGGLSYFAIASVLIVHCLLRKPFHLWYPLLALQRRSNLAIGVPLLTFPIAVGSVAAVQTIQDPSKLTELVAPVVALAAVPAIVF